jgi:hypothetical protein
MTNKEKIKKWFEDAIASLDLKQMLIELADDKYEGVFVPFNLPRAIVKRPTTAMVVYGKR